MNHQRLSNALQLTFTALNLSRTAYASSAFDGGIFFTSYDYQGTASSKGADRFTCQLLNKVHPADTA